MTQINDEQRRVIYLQRIADTLRDDYLDNAFNDAYKRTRAILLEFDELRPTLNRLNLAKKAVEEAVQEALEPAWLKVTQELDELAYNQAAWSASVMTKYTADTLTTPANEFIKRWVDKSLMSLEGGGSGTWSTFVQENIDGFAKQYNKVVSDTFQARLNPAQEQPSLSQQSKQLRQLNDGINRRTAEMLVRTGTNHYATQAKRAMAQDNLDIIAREYPLVTFDNRTSDICISINMKYPDGWVVNKSPIGYPPYHYGERTVIIFMTKGQERFMAKRTVIGGRDGKEAAKRFSEKEKRLRTKSQVTYKGRKDSDIFEIEKIDMRVNFGEWLKNEPDWYIYDTLGKTKGDKFLAGELNLKKLTDTKLRPLRVSEL